jgi:hypothetical protein
MDININKLKKSMTLNQLIQLSANEKEKLIENPSTVIIVAVLLSRNRPLSTKSESRRKVG